MVAAIGAAAGLAGAAISANGAKSAANTQSAASQQATMLQMQAAAQQRQDLTPWVTAGTGAQSALNRYLGIGGVGSGGTTSSGLATGLSPDQVRQQLMSQYTRNTTPGGQTVTPPANGLDFYSQMTDAAAKYHAQQTPYLAPGQGPGYWAPGVGAGTTQNGSAGENQQQWISTANQGQSSSTVDEEGLNAAIAKYYEEQNAQNAQAQSDSTYGSLLRPFHNGEEFDPGPAFSFTGDNLASDPGYQFGLAQGTQGIDRGQASRGNYLSGAAMKELTRFNEDYAGTKFNDAFNRNLTTYNTNLGARQNAWNTNLNAYDNNRSRVYSFLTGVSGLGQASAAGVASGNQQAANSAAGNMLGSANSQAASQVASGNALTSGINSAVNNYNATQNTQNWNNLLAGNNTNNGWNNASNQQGMQDLVNGLQAKYQG